MISVQKRVQSEIWWVAVLLFLTPFGDLYAQNLLHDAGFEASTADGTFPDSGFWKASWLGGDALCTSTSQRDGDNGLWQFTGENSEHWWAAPYQDVMVESGKSYFASIWVRNQFPGSNWIEGSKIQLKLQFLNSFREVLAEYKSRQLTDLLGIEEWTLLFFGTRPAPAGTVIARFVLYLEKPQVYGRTVINFDDGILREIECEDCIIFTQIPECGSGDLLRGHVTVSNPDSYKLTIFIFTGDWWPKPTEADPWTNINPDGTWACDVNIVFSDLSATEIVAFLVHESELDEFPLSTGLPALPGEAFRFPSAGTFRPSCFQTLEFSGYLWQIKESSTRKVGPGPNYFSHENAEIDKRGHLNLKISKHEDIWNCAEVFLEDPQTEGVYAFEIQGNFESLDLNSVFGVFTWDEFAPHHADEEMDIEISRWRDSDNSNAQFVIQPWNIDGNLYRFEADTENSTVTTHIIRWMVNRVQFMSYFGGLDTVPCNENMIASWIYEGTCLPQGGNENIRLNYWLIDGNPLSDVNEAEINVRQFEYLPSSIEFTHIPPQCSRGLLQGRVCHVDPSDYWIAVYVKTDRWYIKPFINNPFTAIKKDGTWKCRINIEKTDREVTDVAAFLLPKSSKTRPPSEMASLDKMSLYESTFAEKPKLSIQKVIANSEGNSMKIMGEYYLDKSEIAGANSLNIELHCLGETVYTTSIPFNPDVFQKNGFVFISDNLIVGLSKKRYKDMNYYGNYSICIQNEKMKGLRSPVELKITIKDYINTAIADEEIDGKIINGSRPMPIIFLKDYADALWVNQMTISPGRDSKSSIKTKGFIAFENTPQSLPAITVYIGSQSFIIPPEAFVKKNNETADYRCKNYILSGGEIISSEFNLDTCNFSLQLRNANLNLNSTIVDFGLQIGDYEQWIVYYLK